MLVLCLILALVLTGCTNNPAYIHENAHTPELSGDYENRYDDEDDGSNDSEPEGENAPAPPDAGDPGASNDFDTSAALDTSSAEAFIESMRSVYHIIFVDDYGLLHDEIGVSRMKELETTLKMYSPGFIRTMVSLYNDMDADFIIAIEESDDDDFGSASWGGGGDLVISLYYKRTGLDGGVNHDTLSHELGHAMHYIIEENIGEDRAEQEMMALNQGFPYTEDYENVWDEELHSPVFAYDYGMYNYLEDWATLVEELMMLTQRGLTTSTQELSERLSDPRNEPLLIKAQYIRDMVYKHISDECSEIFFKLYEVEDFLRAAA